MRTLLVLGMLWFSLAGFTQADEAAPAGNADENQQETLQIDGQDLVLAYEGEADGNSIKEYIPADERLDSWTRLAAVREHAELNDPKEFAEAMVKQLEAKDPPAPYELLVNQETGDVILDFLVWAEDKSFVEFNVFKYQKKEGGGLLSRQYALRAYGDEIENFTAGMDADRRAKLIAEMVGQGAEPGE